MLKELEKQGLQLYGSYQAVHIDEGQQKYDPGLAAAIEMLKNRNTMLWLNVHSKKYKKSSPDGDERAAAIIREIAQMAKKAGIKVALYPHHGFWIERVEDGLRVAQKVGICVGPSASKAPWRRSERPRC